MYYSLLLLITVAAIGTPRPASPPVPVRATDADTAHYEILADTLRVRFPFEFEIPEHKTLYLLGERIRTARFTSAPGGTLYLNGIAVMPRFKCKPDTIHLTDEQYLRLYGNAPYFQELLSRGATPTLAGRAYIDARGCLRSALSSVYREARAAGLDMTESSRAAHRALGDLDTLGLVDHERPSHSSWNWLSLTWAGMMSEDAIQFGDWVPPATVPSMPTEEQKARHVLQMHRLLGTGSSSIWYIIDCSGTAQFGTPESVAQAQRQLDLARATGEITSGILSPGTIKEIVGEDRPILLYGREKHGGPHGALAN
jgi:hypothetical protein